MIPAAQKGYQRAPTSRGAVPADRLNGALEPNMATAAIRTITAAVPTWYGLTWPSSHPLELRRDVLMKLLVLKDELAELEPRLEVGLKSVVAHELLPFVRVVDLLENVDPERLLSWRKSRRRHDRPHDEVVVDRDALRLARGKARVHGGGRAGRHERAQRSHLLGLVELQAFARVVHGRDDATLMAGDSRRDCGARGLADVGEGLCLHQVLDAAEERLILLFRTGPGYRERILFGRVDEILSGLPWTVVVHPEEEWVEREVGDRREVRRLECELLRDDRREEAVERDHHVVHVAGLLVHVLEGDGAGATLLVQWGYRLGGALLRLYDVRYMRRLYGRNSTRCGSDEEL